MSKKYQMHVISGTHWDREWRHTAEQSKPRLIELMQTMIDVLEKRPDYKTYCLDGGMVVLDDYLELRPENKEKIKKFVQDGRINLVSWYTLPEMFTVAPEAIIRNLLLGKKKADEFGGAITAGYTATGYGQTSQLPQIYQGFDIPNAIFYRGTNKHILDPLFCWEGKDGSRIHMLRTFDEVTRTNWFFYIHQTLVLGKEPRSLDYKFNPEKHPVHMCDKIHYERAFKTLTETKDFNKDPQTLKKYLQAILDQAMPYQVSNTVLALNMEDNDVPFEPLPDMVNALNSVSDDVEIVQSSLDQYMERITKDNPLDKLKVHKGELRYPAVEMGFNGLLGATHSSRIKLKVLNEQAETGLTYLAEPLASIASLLGKEYPTAIMQRAWRHLLLNHAHDSICGAAVDQAHEDMLYNFSIARMVSEEITSRSAISIFEKINTKKSFKDGEFTFTMFNNLPYSRKQVLQLMIDLPKEKIFDKAADPRPGVDDQDNEIKFYDIIDDKGDIVGSHELSKHDIQIGIETEVDTNGVKMPMVRRRILVDAEVPAMGYTTYALRPRGPKYVAHPEHGPDRAMIARENGVLENEFIKVQINPNGTFSLLHKETGHQMENLHYFTDNGETGNAHLSSHPMRNPIQTTIGANATITMVESNLLRGIFKIDLSITVPAAATLDSSDRLNETRVIPITTWLELNKDAKYLKAKTKLYNDARDHRLRVNFPSHVNTDTVSVESAFAVDQRCLRWTDNGDNHEQFFPFQPMQNFVDVSDGKIGLAVLNKGLREYEVKDDSDRTIAITLLRTQRAYMTANKKMIAEELEKYTGLHSFGSHEYNYALYPHTGNWESGQVLQQAYDHKVDIPTIQGVPCDKGDLPTTDTFLKISSDKVMLSALKESEAGDGIILRLWNTSSKKVKVDIKTPLKIASAHRLKLNETRLDDVKVSGGKLTLEMGPHKIETILIKQ